MSNRHFRPGSQIRSVRSNRYDSYYSDRSSVRSRFNTPTRSVSERESRRMFAPGRKGSFYSFGHVGQKTPFMVLKNGGLPLAEKEIKSLLDDLYPHSSTEITALEGELSDKFNRLVSYVTLLYDTPDYDTFYRWVTEKYGSQTDINPITTVGGYLMGCSIPTSFSKLAPGCSIACAGSMPRPKSDHTFKHCQQTVMRGHFNGTGYRFTVHRRALNKEDHQNAYLYLNLDPNGNYHGFTEAEKKSLLASGIKKVKLYGYKSDGKDYQELTPNLIPVENLKPRNQIRSDNSAYDKDQIDKHYRPPPTSGSNATWIVIVVIIILVIIFLIWLAWSAHRSREFRY